MMSDVIYVCNGYHSLYDLCLHFDTFAELQAVETYVKTAQTWAFKIFLTSIDRIFDSFLVLVYIRFYWKGWEFISSLLRRGIMRCCISFYFHSFRRYLPCLAST